MEYLTNDLKKKYIREFIQVKMMNFA